MQLSQQLWRHKTVDNLLKMNPDLINVGQRCAHTCVDLVIIGIAKLLQSAWDLTSYSILHNFQETYFLLSNVFSAKGHKTCFVPPRPETLNTE